MPFMLRFADFIRTRSDQNKSVYNYLLGLIQGKRGAKNMERMEEHVEGFSYQKVHNSLSESPWDHRPLMDEVAKQASGLLSGGRRVRLIYDDTGVQKKGPKSVGVARQYIGRLGKVENCQIAVCACLASGQRSTLVDTRLYLPEVWANDPERCAKAKIPKDQQAYKTKAQLALESTKHLRSLGVRFDVISFDSGYGSIPSLLHGLDAEAETFVAEIHCDAHIWTEQPWRHHQPKRIGAKALQHPRASHPSQRVDQYIQGIGELEWKRLKVRDSDQGWVEVSYVAKRVWVAEGDEEKLWWLLAWSNPDEATSIDKHGRAHGPRCHYALSNAPAESDERQLVADGVERNAVERNFREAKSEVGMADYQVRGWLPWQHHMALVMLAMLFMLNEKMHYHPPEGAPPLTTGDITFMMERLLPQRGYGQADPEEVKRMLRERLRKRATDQLRRKQKTARERPPLREGEVLPT
jgi:SRSO17 transposase